MAKAFLVDSLKRQSSRVAGDNSGGAAGNVDHLDRKALERDLAERVEGEVRFEQGTLGLYATDSSNFREAPIGVVIPQTPEAVVEAHRVCCRYGAPVVNRGCETSLSGETVGFTPFNLRSTARAPRTTYTRLIWPFGGSARKVRMANTRAVPAETGVVHVSQDQNGNTRLDLHNGN